MRLWLALAVAMPALSQSVLSIGNADFAKALNRVLAGVKTGEAHTYNTKTGEPLQTVPGAFVGMKHATLGDLPQAAYCNTNEISYTCEWEAKPNKFSAAVLADDIAAHVAAALPKTWKREKGQREEIRFTEFSDPRGMLAVTVLCRTTPDGLSALDYIARLVIHRPELLAR
jgi:hypothetical protein